MRSLMKLLILVLVFTTLWGCAAPIKSEITVFHQLEDPPSPKLYMFVPLDWQEKSLEYESYIDLVRQELTHYNYREITQEELPDVALVLGYGIEGGQTKVGSVPIYGQTGVASSRTYGSVNTYGNYGTYSGTTTYTPSYGVVGSRAYSRTEYTRFLWLKMVDATGPVEAKNHKVLYEANLSSRGSSSQLPEVMPSMIKALFREFPGKNGKPRRETVIR